MFLAPARSALDVVKVQFTGKLTYNNKGELYIDGAGDPEYFGQPSPAIDEAWMDLIGRMILVFLPFFFRILHNVGLSAKHFEIDAKEAATFGGSYSHPQNGIQFVYTFFLSSCL